MSFKIAVGSSDGKVIDQHFGSGNKFYIFELLEDGSFKFIETRENQSEYNENRISVCDNTNNIACNENGHTGCGSNCNSSGHDESGLIRKISLLSDCDAVLVYQIGRGAEKLLIKNGISAFEAKGSIEKAFSKLYTYFKRTKQI